MFKVEQTKMIEPLSGNLFSLYEVRDERGHHLALVNGGDPLLMTFDSLNVAENIASSLNESVMGGDNKVIGKRMQTGQYEVQTERGTFNVEVHKDGAKSNWKVVLPSGESLDDPFPTKREAMSAIAERAR